MCFEEAPIVARDNILRAQDGLVGGLRAGWCRKTSSMGLGERAVFCIRCSSLKRIRIFPVYSIELWGPALISDFFLVQFAVDRLIVVAIKTVFVDPA